MASRNRNEVLPVDEIIDAMQKGASKALGAWADKLDGWSAVIIRMLDGFVKGYAIEAKSGSKVWETIQTESFKTARNMGLSRKHAESMNDALREQYGKISALYDISLEDINKIQDGFTQAIGRNVTLSNEQIESAAAFQKILGDTYGKAIANFDDLGGSTETAGAYLELTQERAARFGLNAKKTSEIFVKNLGMANKFTFSEGVNGLSKMAALSQKMKIDMESVGKAAEKFSTIEGSIETSANLQVLGGSYAANFSNPLENMAMALTDFEGFTDKIVDTFADKGVLNKKSGVVEFSPLDKAFMKEAAKQLGMTYDEVAKLASRQVSVAEIDKHISPKVKDKKNIEAVESIAQFNAESGKYEVTYYNEDGKAQAVAIDELSDDMLNAILPFTDKEDSMRMDVADIAKNVRELLGKGKARTTEGLSYAEKREGFNGSADAGAASWMDPFKEAQQWASSWLTSFASNHPIWASIGRGAWRSIGLGANNILNSFSEGGVIPGQDNGGKDNTLAMVAPNEMVLNAEQQNNLINAIGDDLPHFSDGGVNSEAQARLFALANNSQVRNGQSDESSGFSVGGIAQNVLIGYGLKTAAKNDELINSLNNLGKAIVDQKKALLESNTRLGKALNASSKVLNKVAHNRATRLISKGASATQTATVNLLGKSRIGRTVLEVSRLYGRQTIGKGSIVAKNVKDLSLLKEGRIGDWFKAFSKNNIFGRAIRTIEILGSEKGSKHARLFAKSLKPINTLRNIRNIWSSDVIEAPSNEIVETSTAQGNVNNSNVHEETFNERRNRGRKHRRTSGKGRGGNGRGARGRYASSKPRTSLKELKTIKSIAKESEKLAEAQLNGANAIREAVNGGGGKTLLKNASEATNTVVTNSESSVIKIAEKATSRISKEVAEKGVETVTSNVAKTATERVAESVVKETTKETAKSVGGGIKGLGSKAAKLFARQTLEDGSKITFKQAVKSGLSAKGLAKSFKGAGGLVTAAFAGYELYNAFSANAKAKEAIENDASLSNKDKKRLLREADDEKNGAIGGVIGSAIGASIGTAFGGPVGAAIGGIIGDKIGNFVGKNWNNAKDFLFGKNAEDQMTDEDIAQQEYEETKFGSEAMAAAMEDESGESIKILAAQATVKMSDLLVSIWHHMNGKLSNGEEKKEGLFSGIGNFLGKAAPIVAAGAAFAIPGIGPLLGATLSTALVTNSIFGGSSSKDKNSDEETNIVRGKISKEDIDNGNVDIFAQAAYSTCQIYALLSAKFGASEDEEGNIEFYPLAKAQDRVETNNFVETDKVFNNNNPIAVQPIDSSNDIEVKSVVGQPTYIEKRSDNSNITEYSVERGNSTQDINLNINGTLRLVGDNSTAKLYMNDLLDNPQFREQLLEIISRGLNEKSNFNGKVQSTTASRIGTYDSPWFNA